MGNKTWTSLSYLVPAENMRFSNSSWKMVGILYVNYYFYFSPLALHCNSYKVSLYLLLFLSYTDNSRQGLRNSQVFLWASVLYPKRTLRVRLRALTSRPGRCFSSKPEPGTTSINCPVLKMKRTRSWGSDPFVFPPLLPSM